MDDNDTDTLRSRLAKKKWKWDLVLLLYCPTEILIFKSRSSFLLHEGMFR
jgi:hypothetical protein